MPPETQRNLPEHMQIPLNVQQKEVKRMLNKQGHYDDKVLEVGDHVRVLSTLAYVNCSKQEKKNSLS